MFLCESEDGYFQYQSFCAYISDCGITRLTMKTSKIFIC